MLGHGMTPAQDAGNHKSQTQNPKHQDGTGYDRMVEFAESDE